MEKFLKTMVMPLGLGMFLCLVPLGGPAGCGGSDDEEAADDDAADDTGDSDDTGEDDDGDGTATSDQAELAANVVGVGISGFLMEVGANPGLRSDGSLGLLSGFKGELTVEPTSSCSDGDVPAISGGTSFTINAADLGESGGESGSCTGSYSGSDDDIDARMDCSDFTTSNGAVDGTVGLNLTTPNNDFVIVISSEDLTATIGDLGACSFVIDVTETVSQNTVSLDGCVSLCGEAFELGGSESL